jgi:gliding motility-associated-like protein
LITFTSSPSGYDSYQFFYNSTSSPLSTNNFYATGSMPSGNSILVWAIVTLNGCTNSDTIPVTVKQFPTAFTPNGDGKNDLFLKGIHILVFNRWGQELYKGVDGWDGTYNGKKVSPGTYYYIATLIDLDNNKTEIKGSVTIADRN